MVYEIDNQCMPLKVNESTSASRNWHVAKVQFVEAVKSMK
jgi:hypothetical protein